MKFQLTALVALLLPSASLVAADSSVTDYGVLEWINNANGGMVHPDQEFRANEDGIAGMYATKDIKKGEILIQVPWSLILKSDNPHEEGQMCCGTVHAVAREMRKGNESFYAPYVNYLHAQSENATPSAWSDLGKKLLREVVGGTVTETEIPPVEPTEWLEFDWYGRCRGSRADQLSTKAALLVVQRSDDSLMIPGT